MFDHKCVFHVKSGDALDMEELELELIDYGGEEVFLDEEEEEIVIYGTLNPSGPFKNTLKKKVLNW